MTDSPRAQRIAELKSLREQKLAELNKERELIEGTEILSRLLNIDKDNLVWSHDEENLKLARQLHAYHKRFLWERSPGYTDYTPTLVQKVKDA